MSWGTGGGEAREAQSSREGRCWPGGGRQAGKLGPLGEGAPAIQTSSNDARKREKVSGECPGGKERVLLGQFWRKATLSQRKGDGRASSQDTGREISARPNEFQ